MEEKKLKQRLVFMVATVILLICGLAITSYALAYAIVRVENHIFIMDDGVEIEVNDGKPIVGVQDILFQPGDSYKSEFSVSNPGTIDVWYRIYFTDVEGGLKDDITVIIKEKDGTVLCNDTMDRLTTSNVFAGSLDAGSEKILDIEFIFSEESDNSAQGNTVTFNITVDATQKKHNPDKVFD